MQAHYLSCSACVGMYSFLFVYYILLDITITFDRRSLFQIGLKLNGYFLYINVYDIYFAGLLAKPYSTDMVISTSI